MSFDVYVGSFTRYITGDWENQGQQMARETGVPYQLIRADETEEAPPPSSEVRQAVENWRAAINGGLGEHLEEPLSWDESDETPYFTERPGWPGYASLLLHAAYDDHSDLKKPERLPEEWGDDPAYKAASEKNADTSYPALLAANLWLPGEFDFMFGVEDLGGNERSIASCGALLEELRELNERTFKGQDAELAAWRAQTVEEKSPLDAHAKNALALLIALAESAVENKLPMMLDY
jgi:hypothetical protein